MTDWHALAIHALADLDYLGVPLDQMVGVTPEILAEVEEYQRNMTSFS